MTNRAVPRNDHEVQAGPAAAHRARGHPRGAGPLRRVRDLRRGSRLPARRPRSRRRRLLPPARWRPLRRAGQLQGHVPGPLRRDAQAVAGNPEPHRAVGAAPGPAPHRRRGGLQRRERAVPARSAGRPDPGRHPRGRAGVEAGQVGGRRPTLLPDGRASGGQVVGRADRRRGRHPGLLPRQIRQANGSDHLLAELGLTSGGYHLVVARFEPENHVDMIVEGYAASSAELPLIVVGSAPYADAYTQRVHSMADDRVTFLGGVWDQELLDQLYANAFTYLHGHSVGGTNPSLLRALGASAATTAFDVNFNREVLGEAGRYFHTAADVRTQVEDSESDVALTVELGTLARIQAKRYDWDEVTDRYEELCLRLAGRDRALSGAGHRAAAADDTVVELAERPPLPVGFPAGERLFP